MVCNGAISHMALRVARGLFRLWLLLTVLWIAVLGLLLWHEWPQPYPPLECEGVGTISECMDRLEKAGKNPFGHSFDYSCYDGSRSVLPSKRELPSCRTYFATISEKVSARRRGHLIFAA